MKNMNTKSPAPAKAKAQWVFSKSCTGASYGIWQDGEHIASAISGEERARLIVSAVNNAAALRSALEGLLTLCSAGALTPPKRMHPLDVQEVREKINAARAALEGAE